MATEWRRLQAYINLLNMLHRVFSALMCSLTMSNITVIGCPAVVLDGELAVPCTRNPL